MPIVNLTRGTHVPSGCISASTLIAVLHNSVIAPVYSTNGTNIYKEYTDWIYYGKVFNKTDIDKSHTFIKRVGNPKKSCLVATKSMRKFITL